MNAKFLFTLQLFVSASCLLDGPYACKNIGRSYCCPDYEEKNGECVACKIGFTSLGGQLCKPCRQGMYGQHCFTQCRCAGSQRCHHIYGCVLDILASETINDDMTVVVTSQSINFNFSEIDRNEFSKLDLMIYSVIITCVGGTFFVIGFVYFCWRFIKTIQEKKSLANTGFVDSTNEILEMYEEIYDTIDEDDIVQSDNADTYIEAVNISSDSESSITNSEAFEGICTHSYSNLIERREIHTYDEYQPGQESRSQQIIIEGWMPYARCLNAQPDESNYELQSFVIVHAADKSSSEYESEKEESDSSGYLNPLIDSENASLIYDISNSFPKAETNPAAKTYLEADNGLSISERGTTNSEAVGVCPQLYSTREIHSYDKCQPKQKERSEKNTQKLNIRHVESLTPCSCCLEAQRDDSNDELQPIVAVHATDTSASEYESEKEESDSSGYLNPLTDSDNASLVYDISISVLKAEATPTAKANNPCTIQKAL